MSIETVKCECCGLKEDCTQEYINKVRSDFDGKWICGLCSEAVKYEAMKKSRNKKTTASYETIEEAINAHMLFCGKFRLNPALKVAEGLRQMLRRRSPDQGSNMSD